VKTNGSQLSLRKKSINKKLEGDEYFKSTEEEPPKKGHKSVKSGSKKSSEPKASRREHLKDSGGEKRSGGGGREEEGREGLSAVFINGLREKRTAPTKPSGQVRKKRIQI